MPVYIECKDTYQKRNQECWTGFQSKSSNCQGSDWRKAEFLDVELGKDKAWWWSKTSSEIYKHPLFFGFSGAKAWGPPQPTGSVIWHGYLRRSGNKFNPRTCSYLSY